MSPNAGNRATRLVRLRDLLLANPRGFTARELAEITGVHIRTVERDLLDLQSDLGVPLLQEGRRWVALHAASTGPLQLTLPEARALYVSVRLLLRYADEADPAAAAALTKLVNHLPEAMRGPVLRTIDVLHSRPLNTKFTRILDTVTAAWADRRVLRIQYRSAGRDEAREVILEPYLLEASASGYATYVIGYSRSHGDIRTLKIERMESAHLTPETFTPQPDVDIEQLLETSWSVMWGEDTEVTLKFAPEVTRRVKEAIWHPSQQIEDTEDGGCILRLRVGHPVEVAPWIRSWGAAVEVLDPPEFRAEMAAEARRLAAIYNAEGM